MGVRRVARRSSSRTPPRAHACVCLCFSYVCASLCVCFSISVCFYICVCFSICVCFTMCVSLCVCFSMCVLLYVCFTMCVLLLCVCFSMCVLLFLCVLLYVCAGVLACVSRPLADVSPCLQQRSPEPHTQRRVPASIIRVRIPCAWPDVATILTRPRSVIFHLTYL